MKQGVVFFLSMSANQNRITRRYLNSIPVLKGLASNFPLISSSLYLFVVSSFTKQKVSKSPKQFPSCLNYFQPISASIPPGSTSHQLHPPTVAAPTQWVWAWQQAFPKGSEAASTIIPKGCGKTARNHSTPDFHDPFEYYLIILFFFFSSFLNDLKNPL